MDAPRRHGHDPHDALQGGGFARPVPTDEGDQPTWWDIQADPAQNNEPFNADPDVIDAQHTAPIIIDRLRAGTVFVQALSCRAKRSNLFGSTPEIASSRRSSP